jgi:hypothetical protein
LGEAKPCQPIAAVGFIASPGARREPGDFFVTQFDSDLQHLARHASWLQWQVSLKIDFPKYPFNTRRLLKHWRKFLRDWRDFKRQRRLAPATG